MGSRGTRILKNSILIAMTILTFGILIYVAILPHTDRTFRDEYAYEFMEGWTYTDADGRTEEVRLNEKLPENIDDGVRVENVLPEKGSIPYNTIAFYSHYQRFRIYLNDSLLADSTDQYADTEGFSKNDGVFWYLVRLPDESEGARITVEVTSMFKNHRYIEQQVYIGYKWPILLSIFRDGAFFLLGAAILILFSIIFLEIYIITIRKGGKMVSTGYLSGTLFWIGFWILDQCGLMQFFMGNARLINYLGFAPIIMGTVFAMLYLMSIMKENFRTLNGCILTAMALCWTIETILQFTGKMEYYSSIPAYHLIIGIFIAAMLGETFWVSFVRRDKSMRITFFLVLLLVGYTGIQLIIFYKNGGIGYNEASGMVLFLLIFVVMLYEIIRADRMIAMANMSAHYKQTSVTDQMTGLANKRGLNEWIDQHKGDFERIVTAAFVLDLNKLKYLNDNYGHQTGDAAITAAADIIRQVFGPHGIAARTGGDEFTCIVLLEEGQTADRLQEQFLEHVRNKARELSFPFSVSIGYSFFEKNESIENMVKKADEAMYRMKKATGMERRD